MLLATKHYDMLMANKVKQLERYKKFLSLYGNVVHSHTVIGIQQVVEPFYSSFSKHMNKIFLTDKDLLATRSFDGVGEYTVIDTGKF